jgi:hypothetical protein
LGSSGDDRATPAVPPYIRELRVGLREGRKAYPPEAQEALRMRISSYTMIRLVISTHAYDHRRRTLPVQAER